MVVELGLITPPIGMNVFVLKGIAREVPLETIFRGVTPFIVAQIILIVVLIAFPEIALWLPSTMSR
jgi:C4-dicarboxylate transporter DctM subunit